jgi:hypothetical protein
MPPEPGYPRMADSPVVLQGQQSFQVFNARFPMGCSTEDIPVVERDENEGRGEQKKEKYNRQSEAAAHKSQGAMRDHNIRSSRFVIGTFAPEH